MGLLAGKAMKGKEPLRKQKGYWGIVRKLNKAGIILHKKKGVMPHYSDKPTKLMGPLVGKVFKGKGYIAVDPSAKLSVLAHEAGHATGNPAVKRILQKMYMPSKIYGVAAIPFLAAAAIAAGDTSFTDSDEERIKKLTRGQYAMGASTLPYAPVMAEEARATKRGLGMLNKILGRKAALKGLGVLGPAYGTYAMALAAPAIGALALQSRKNKARKRLAKKRKKN